MKRVIKGMVILLLAVFMLFGCTDPVEFPEDNKETPAVPVEPESEKPKLTVDDFPTWLKETTWKITTTVYLDDEKLDTQESVGKLPSDLFSLEKYGFSGNAEGTAKATDTAYEADLEEDLSLKASDGSLKTQHVELVADYIRDGNTCHGSTKLTQTDKDGTISRITIEYVLVEVEDTGA